MMINSNKVYVLMHKYILAFLRAHFNDSSGQNESETGQNIFKPANINSFF